MQRNGVEVPPELPNTARLVVMAVWLVGDSEAVRKCLQCSEVDFQDYMAGRKEPWGTWSLLLPSYPPSITLCSYPRGETDGEFSGEKAEEGSGQDYSLRAFGRTIGED